MSLTKPRVAVFCHTGLYSGAEVVLERLVRAAIENGWHVTILVPDGPARERLAATGATIRDGPDLRLPPGPKILGSMNRGFVSINAARLLRQEAARSDLVLVNGFHALPVLALARLKVPSVWFLHQVITSRYRLALVRLTRHAGYVTVAVSESAAAPIRKLGLPVEVVHNGTPSPVRPAPDEPPDRAVVGCAASLTKWKGQDVLLDAAAHLDPSVHVDLLGPRFPKDAGFEQQLRERASRADLAGRVRFLGFRDDVLEVMRSWTVAVSASIDPEAVGLTTLEAMSVGIPVVGTDIGATPAIVDGAGLLVPPGDPRAMATAISRLLADGDLWRRCHKRGPEVVQASYSLDRQLENMLELLQQIVSQGPSPGSAVARR